MDYKVGTSDGKSDGLQVLGVGEPWPIYLEGMEECYILEPLVIRGPESQCKPWNIFLDGAQIKVDLHGGVSRTNAHKRWVSREIPVGRRRMS